MGDSQYAKIEGEGLVNLCFLLSFHPSLLLASLLSSFLPFYYLFIYLFVCLFVCLFVYNNFAYIEHGYTNHAARVCIKVSNIIVGMV